MRPKPAYASPYCLHCYAPLGEVQAPSTHCAVCGHANLVVDLRRLWTREKRLRELEHLLKVIVALFIGAISLAALFSRQSGMSAAGHGMGVGAPILLGLLLWDAVSITQRESLFRGSIVWPIVGWAFVVPATALALAVPLPMVRWIAGAVALGSLAGILSPLTRRRWIAWRERHVLAGQQALASSTAAAS
ncbi:MAG: hypothetical protein H6828_02255 [Planctomycetes bacterium]|nr:hypothetical protein [Planctomycetota bacterium]